MLTKELSTKAEQKLSVKDCQKLQRSVTDLFNLSEAASQTLLPKKDVTQRRVSSGAAQARLYIASGTPVLFEPPVGGAPMPTLAALWKNPELKLPVIYVPPPVSLHLIKGADLMLPGIIEADGLSGAPVGSAVCVCVRGNPAPFALGRTLMAGLAIDEALSSPSRTAGRAVETLHCFGDALWRSCGRHVPNDGFIDEPRAVVPLDGAAAPLMGSRVSASKGGPPIEGEESTAPGGGEVPAAPESDAAEDATSEASLIATLGSVDVSDAAEAAGTPRGGATDDGNEEEAPPTERSAAVAREEADALLTFCFWQACHRVSDKELPMATNAFWAAHMRPLRPAGSSLEFRGSSWKKLGAFLKHMASQGCCELDEPKSAKSGSEPMLRQIVRGSAGYQEHVPMENTAEAAEAAARAADHGIGAPPVSVTRCFRPSEAQRGIFEAAGCSTADRKALYSEADVKGVLDAYLKSEGLLGERAMVTLSPGLTDALFRKDDAGTRPTALAAHECKKRWLDRLEGWWRISGGTLEKPTLCKSPPRVEISTTKRRGHDVTLVANLSALGIEEATFAAEAQKLASCAVTIEEIEASKQGKVHKVVVVQGLWDRSISEHLAGTLPAAAIDNKAAAKGGQMAQKKDKKATNVRRA